MPKWYDTSRLYAKESTFNFVFGGRGIGKTYGILRDLLIDKIDHIYLRRMQKEIDITVNKNVHPYLSPALDMGKEITVKTIDGIVEVSESVKDGLERRAFAAALSTFNNIRGGDFRTVKVIVYDEFIKSKSSKATIKNEADAFFNMYESVARNRELTGEEPVIVYFLSNAVSIDSPILSELGLIPVLEMMIRKGMEFWRDRDRSICIQLVDSECFAAEKSLTALGRLTEGTRYFDHAVNNKFAYDSYYNVISRPIVEYKPKVCFDMLYIYKHKSNNKYYASMIRGECPTFNEDTKALFWRRFYLELKEAVITGRMEYESYTTKLMIYKVLELN